MAKVALKAHALRNLEARDHAPFDLPDFPAVSARARGSWSPEYSIITRSVISLLLRLLKRCETEATFPSFAQLTWGGKRAGAGPFCRRREKVMAAILAQNPLVTFRLPCAKSRGIPRSTWLRLGSLVQSVINLRSQQLFPLAKVAPETDAFRNLEA